MCLVGPDSGLVGSILEPRLETMQKAARIVWTSNMMPICIRPTCAYAATLHRETHRDRLVGKQRDGQLDRHAQLPTNSHICRMHMICMSILACVLHTHHIRVCITLRYCNACLVSGQMTL